MKGLAWTRKINLISCGSAITILVPGTTVAMGDQYADTPNIDRLAAEGVCYTNAFTAGPICSPWQSRDSRGKELQ